ncbi:fibronectin type III domain-containing protein [Candidatus Riflebacteria bacterium]
MRIYLAFLILLSSFLYFGCLSSSDLSDKDAHAGKGRLSVKVSFKHSVPQGSIDPSAFGVTTIRVTVTPSSGEPVVKSFSYTPGGHGSISGIPVGQANVKVEALDSAARIVFSGSINVEVIADVVTKVDSLVLFEEADSSVALAIAGIQVSNILATSARIDFLTNRGASVVITYGLSSTSLTESQNADSTPVTNHQVLLSGLLPQTQYFYKITVDDGLGSTAESSVLSFTTSTEGETSEFFAKINDGAAYTNNELVTLNLGASAGTTQVKIAEGTSAQSATAQSFSSSINFTVSTGDGTKTVTVIFLDANGGALAELSATITLDQTAPTVSSLSASNITDTNATITGTADEKVLWNFQLGKTASYELYNATDTSAMASNSINNADFGTLEAATTYYYRAIVTDLAGNSHTATGGTFTTNAASGVTLNNTYVSEFGSAIPWGDDGTLQKPRLVAIDAAGVSYVATDDNYNNFQVFDANGYFVKSFGGKLPNILLGKTGLDVQPDGSKLILAFEGWLFEIDLSNPVSSRSVDLTGGGVAGLLDVKIGSDSKYIGLVENTETSGYAINNVDITSLNIVATFPLNPYSSGLSRPFPPLNNLDFLPPDEVAWSRGEVYGGSTIDYQPAFFRNVVSTPASLSPPLASATSFPPQSLGLVSLRSFPAAIPVKYNAAGSKIFVGDPDQDRILVFDTAVGSFTSTFGSAGNASATGSPIELNHPAYLDIAPDNNLHIVDYYNSRIVVANPSTGNLVREYGTASPPYHTLEFSDIEIANTDKLYAVRPSDGSQNSGLVSIYTDNTGFMYNLCFSPRPANPYRIAHVPGSSTFFTLHGTSPYWLARWGETVGTCTVSFQELGPSMGGGVYNIQDLIYVPSTNEVWITASGTASHIHRFKAGNLNYNIAPLGIGTNIGQGGAAPQPDGLFTGPYGIATDDSSVFISDHSNQRIQVWTVAGSFSKSYSLTFKPHMIVFVNSRLYITDPDNNTVHILSSTDGSTLASFGSYGTGQGQFEYPKPIAVSPTHFWIGDANQRLQKFLQ